MVGERNMKNMIIKDFFMEIKKSFNRFISILLIVILGVAFFAGTRAAELDMRYTADEYYDKRQLMDIRIMGTLGLTQEDVDAVRQMDGVSEAIGGYFADTVSMVNGSQLVFRVMADMGDKNRVDVLEGRMPEKAGECLVDIGNSMADMPYEIGDILVLESGSDSELSDTLATDTYEIVGIGSSPEYVSYTRGSTTVGDGAIDAFVVVTEDSFALDVYTKIDVWVEGAESEVVYTKGYDEKVETVLEKIEQELADVRCEVRYEEVLREPREDIEQARVDLADAKVTLEEELADAKAELESAEAEIEDGQTTIDEKKTELADARNQVYSGWQQIADAKAEIEASEAQLAEGWKQYDDGVEQYNQGIAELEASRTVLDDSWKQYQSGLAMYEMMQANPQADAQMLEAMRIKLEEGKASLDAAEAQYLAGQNQLNGVKAVLDATLVQLTDGQTRLEAAKAEVALNEEKLYSAYVQVTDGEQQLMDAEAELEDAKLQLEDGWNEYYDGKAEAEREIADAQIEIDDAQEQLDAIEYPKWYVSDRSTLPDHTGFGDNADRIGAIAKWFPLMFFVVAALISLTTMTRMVEEQRVQIGTLKALGYSKLTIAGKYIAYALLATVGGSLIGVLVGQKLMPYVLVTSYKLVYPHVDNLTIPYDWSIGIMASLVAVGFVTLATVLACYKELAAVPAALMRPVPPKQGKRILLERVTPLWKLLSFSQKSTLRNLFRYKKRLFMTLFGISGCMALVIVGFGIKDSIGNVVTLQYDKVQPLGSIVTLDEDAADSEMEMVYDYLNSDGFITHFKDAYMNSFDVEVADKTMAAYMIVPKDKAQLEEFLYFNDRETGISYELDDNGVIITEKMGQLLNLEPGDTFIIKIDEFTNKEVTVSYVCENYVAHYIYMTPAYYEQVFGEAISYNSLLLRFASLDEKSQMNVSEKLLVTDAVLNVMFLSDMRQSLEDILGALNIIVVVLIIAAGLLAFVVLYNLNNININERRRELATLKVLGFYDMEVANYVYRENIYLTLISMVIGVVLGKYLHRFIMLTVEIDECMFSRQINLSSYIYGAVLTIIFSLIVNFVMFYKLRKIDMVESLKSVE